MFFILKKIFKDDILNKIKLFFKNKIIYKIYNFLLK